MDKQLGIGIAMLCAAGAIGVSATIYHVAVHPEWTQAQALRAMWPAYLASVVLSVGATATMGGSDER